MVSSDGIKHPWTRSIEEIYTLLSTSKNGLSSDEAKKRFSQDSQNTITEKNTHKLIQIFLSQFKNWLVLILIAAAILSFFLGEQIDALVILGIVFLSVFFGFIQEYKAHSTLIKLKKLISTRTKVLRDGNWIELDSREVTLGDVIQLHIGDKVPADLRLLEIDDLTIDEAIITGESKTVAKSTAPIPNEKAQLYQQSNSAFSGSFVSRGTGIGVVYAIGDNSYIGKTAQSITSAELPTDFQKQINTFSKFLLKVVIVLTLFVFFANALLQKGIFSSFLFAVALAVGIAPELLPMIITVTLSQGASNLAKKKVIVKKLSAVEDLGNIDTLCCDKTGTLTEGSVCLSGFQNMDGEIDLQILKYALMCTNAFDSLGKTARDPIDHALWKYQNEFHSDLQFETFSLCDENEFDFKRRMMSVVVKSTDGYTLLAKGSPDSILDRCETYQSYGETIKFSSDIFHKVNHTIHTQQTEGFRILALAKKSVTSEKSSISEEKGLTLIGILLFTDPIKKTVPAALTLLKHLGVGVKLISGDAPEIVLHAAKNVGLIERDEKVILGAEIDNLTETEIEKVAENHTLFARVTPEQKYKLVASLNSEGHIVGFLGDGINDAPALKAADVGIAVDTSAEIAKDAADFILLDKDLHVIVSGIQQGRKTFANITKYILNTISANYGNMVTVAFSSLFLPFIPLLPKQILLTNFISDIPLMAIAADKVDQRLLKKPKRWNIKLLGKFMIYFGIISSLFDFATILPLIFIFKTSPEVFRTAWFIESSLSEILVTFAIRTQLPFYKSRPGNLLVGLSIAASIVILSLPFIPQSRNLFAFSQISAGIFLWIFIVLAGYFFTTEKAKHKFFQLFENHSSHL